MLVQTRKWQKLRRCETNFHRSPANLAKLCSTSFGSLLVRTKALFVPREATRDTNNIIFSSIHNERQHNTPEPPKKPVSATWSKRVTPTTSFSLASTTNFNITPQNPEPHWTPRNYQAPWGAASNYIVGLIQWKGLTSAYQTMLVRWIQLHWFSWSSLGETCEGLGCQCQQATEQSSWIAGAPCNHCLQFFAASNANSPVSLLVIWNA